MLQDQQQHKGMATTYYTMGEVYEKQVLAPNPPRGVLVSGQAGLVMNKLSHKQPSPKYEMALVMYGKFQAINIRRLGENDMAVAATYRYEGTL